MKTILRITKQSLFTKNILLFLAILLSLSFFSNPALAELRVCNQTPNQLNIALGYRAERGWQSEGWWLVASNDCVTVFQGDLNARFYYLFAADDIGGGAWDGAIYLCTRDEAFTIFGTEDCLARGYERTGFFEVDTQNQVDWTVELTEKSITSTSGSESTIINEKTQ